MKNITMKKVAFRSFMKLSVIISFSNGIIFGVIALIIGLLGGNVSATLGTTVLTGVPGGIASFFISPILFAILGVLFGLICFLPFKLLLILSRGLSIKGKFESLDVLLQEDITDNGDVV